MKKNRTESIITQKNIKTEQKYYNPKKKMKKTEQKVL